MKKFILLLTMVLTLAFAASCFATENSSALNDAEALRKSYYGAGCQRHFGLQGC